MRARAASAEARAQQAKAALDQAEMNLQYTVLKAPLKGTISRKTAEIAGSYNAYDPDKTWTLADAVEAMRNVFGLKKAR